MKGSELRLKSEEELEGLMREYRMKLSSLKFDAHAGKVKNIREIRNFKKDIARFLTVIREKKPNS